MFQTLETQTPTHYGRYQSTQLTLVKSQSCSPRPCGPRGGRIPDDPRAGRPIEWLQDKLRVEFIAGSEVMEISLIGSDPEEVAGIVNAVKKAYMDEVVNVDLKRRTERFEQLKKIRDKYTQMLKKRRDTLRKLAETVGSDDRETLAFGSSMRWSTCTISRRSSLEIQSQRRQARGLLKTDPRDDETSDWRAEPASPSEEAIDRMVEQHPAILALVESSLSGRSDWLSRGPRSSRLSRKPDAEPSIDSPEGRVKGVSRLLARRRKEVRPEVIRLARREANVDEDAEARDLEPELAMLADLKRQLDDEIKSI